MLWASILLPSLALDGALRNRQSVDGPFALVAGPVQQRRLVAVNAYARNAGLRPGQRLAEAGAICRDLITEEHDPHRLESDLALIAAWAYRYSSEVALAPPRAVVLEVGKSLRLFGPWPKLETRLRQELIGLGFRHRVALAPNPCAAKVLAGVRDGACIADAEVLERALAPIPIARAGLPDGAVGTLPGMGIRTLGQLMALPRAALERRFGKGLVLDLDRLLGQSPHAYPSYRPPDRFEGHVELPFEVTHHITLLFPLKRLVGDLAAFVSARDGGVQEFTVRFGHEYAATTDIALGLLSPQREAPALFEVVKLRLERTTLPQPVVSLGVIAETLPPFVPAGHDLFDARPANAIPFEQLCERLRARLGDGAVHGLATDPDPRPERASVHDGAGRNASGGPRLVGRTPSAAPPPAGGQCPLYRTQRVIQGSPRPAWLLARPIPLRGMPPRILAGPERLEAGWWDGGDIRRDYYVIETRAGQRAWAFCPPGERGPFMLHGWFA